MSRRAPWQNELILQVNLYSVVNLALKVVDLQQQFQVEVRHSTTSAEFEYEKKITFILLCTACW